MSATIDMSAILAIVRYVSFAVSIILILRMLRTYRRVRAISRRSCVIAIAFPGAALLVYSVLIGSGLPSTTLSALFAFGLALGLWQGRKTGVWVEGGLPRAQNTIWFLFVWTISYVLMQALVQFGNRSSVKIGFASMMATTAIAVGCQGLILIRLSQGGLPARGAAVGRPRWTARTSGFPAAARAAPEVAGAARGGSSPIRPSGAKVALRARGTAAWQGLEGGVVPRDLGQAGAAALGPHGVRRFCSACGAALVGGDRFCRKCGSVIR